MNRIIHTHLYSNIAKEVLQSVEGQLSDGIWENSPAAEKYWKFSNVKTAPDGEVLIEIDSETYKHETYRNKWTNNGFAEMTDAEVIEWFAAKVKQIMQIELKDNNSKNCWKRDCMIETSYLSYNEKITVADVYFIYDFLMGRDVSKKYNADMNLKIVGAPKSANETKKEETRRANLAKLEAEFNENLVRLEAEKLAAIKKLEDEFNKKRSKLSDKFIEAKRNAV